MAGNDDLPLFKPGDKILAKHANTIRRLLGRRVTGPGVIETSTGWHIRGFQRAGGEGTGGTPVAEAVRYAVITRRKRISDDPPRWLYHAVEVDVNWEDYTYALTPGGFDSDGAILPQQSSSPSAPTLLDPVPGSVLTPEGATAGSVTFTWSTVAGATSYRLSLGATAGGAEFGSFTLSGTTQSVALNTLSDDGSVVHVTVECQVGGEWFSNAYTYYDPASTAHLLRNAAEHNNAPNGHYTFPSVQSDDSYKPHLPADAILVPVGGYPDIDWIPVGEPTGWTLAENPPLVRFAIEYGYGIFYQRCTHYSNCGNSRVPRMSNPLYAELIDPAPFSTLGDSTVTFTIASQYAGDLEHWLMVGDLNAGFGDGSFYNGSLGLGTSQVVTGLPGDGRALCVRVGTRRADQRPPWNYNDYRINAHV